MSVPVSQSRPANGVARSDSKLSAKALYEQRKKYSNSNFITQETSQYHVEHLSTFIMDKAESIVTVDDAIKKLALLDSKDKIWTQEMLLQVTDKAVRLLDCDTEEELENFPLPIIHMSQAVLNKTRYPSVLLLVCQDKEQHKPDIHFFHCDQVEAELVHADIDSALGDNKHGKKMRLQTLKVNQEKMKRHRETILPPQASRGPPPSAKGRAAAPSTQERRSPSQSDAESHEKLAQRIEKDVQMLNCALDDIELFVARLQKAAEAFAQLKQRNKSKKNKKKGPAEGMLTLRAKPPSEAEFVDSLQKMKLAFNLLAKLKKHIQNPSASELLHFLFGPLELVIKSCGGPDLVRSIISPHLSRDAVDFLRGHLTPKETATFEMLGEGWTRSRAEWPRDKCAPPYYPKFRNGWEPPAELFRTAPWETEGLSGPPRPSEFSEPSRPLISPDHRNHPSPDHDHDHIFAPHPPGLSNESHNGMPHPRKYAKTQYNYVARNFNELSVLQDEILEVLEDEREWWKLRNRSGGVGYVPSSMLDVVDEPNGPHKPKEVYKPSPPPGPVDGYKGRPKQNGMDKVNIELLEKITGSKNLPLTRNFHVKSQTTSSKVPPLTFNATPEQVTEWLSAKGFTKAIVDCLGILTGAQLFSLNKEELTAVCGDEGSRVNSLLTLEKTQAEKARESTELDKILKEMHDRIGD